VAIQLDCKFIWFLDKNCILTCKSHMFCSISFFRSFFSSSFCYKTIVIYSKSILSARLVLVKRSLLKKPHYLLCVRHLFFKEAALGRPKVCNCRQTDFFKKFFSFFHHLKHPLFRAANLSKMRLSFDTVVLSEGGCEFRPLPGGVSGKRFYEQNLCFT
jgi:hypothetical protein